MEHPKEACGLFGIYGAAPVAPLIFRGLFSLQHRGQEGAGIVTGDGSSVRCIKGSGLLTEVMAHADIRELTGHLGIGHVRYSTTGASRAHNVQPLLVECIDGMWAIAHNGNLINARALRQMYQESGAIFQTSTDSEVLVHLLADPMFRARPRRVARALGELHGAFAFLLMTERSIMAARDPHGFKPLSIGRLGDGWVVASETCALTQVGAVYERDVQPGELVTIDDQGLRSEFFCDPPREPRAQCVFELVYFARPDSRVFGHSVHSIRHALGQRLAREHPADADVVIPVPDSGNSAALGFSSESGIPLNYGFIRNHYVGRTFIMPEVDQRALSVDMKLAVVDDVVRDQRVVVVDDSIVRGTTSRRRVEWLRQVGAREVHLRIASPPTRHPCFFGIDFPSTGELAAAGRDLEEIRRFLNVDSLGYLSIDGLLEPLGGPRHYCAACFSGQYPVAVEASGGKLALERFQGTLDFSSKGSVS